jgi:hypothetical protein
MPGRFVSQPCNRASPLFAFTFLEILFGRSFTYDLVEVPTDLIQVEHDLVQVRTDLVQVRTDLVEVRTDLVEVRTDLVEVRTDLVEVRTDLVEVRTDLVQVGHDLVEVCSDLVQVGRDLVQVGYPGVSLRPVVIDPDTVPVVRDAEEAIRAPELAVLSAIVHGQGEAAADIARATFAAVRDLSLVAVLTACGGDTVGQHGGEAPDSGHVTHPLPVSDAGSDTSTDEASACFDVVVTPGDVACDQDSDCAQTNSGRVCEDTCPCGGTAVNNAAASRIATEVQGLEKGECECPAFGTPTCVNHACTLCGGFMQPAGCVPIDCTFNASACDGGLPDSSIVDGGVDVEVVNAG